MLMLILSGIIGLIIGNRTVLFTSFGCAGILALFLKNASNDNLKNPTINQQIKVSIAHINLAAVSDVENFWNILKDSTIDAVIVYEYTPDWDKVLKVISKNYKPYYSTYTKDDVYGKAIFSAYPILNTDTILYDKNPNLQCLISKNSAEFNILSTYITPSLSTSSSNTSSQELSTIANHLIYKQSHTIVSGEFNQVYWSFDVMNFRTKTNLQNSRRSINPSSLKMPYQHIFYSHDLECTMFEDLFENKTTDIGCKGTYQIKDTYI